MSRDALVIAGLRTPFARLDGDLAPLDAQAIGAQLVRALVAEVGIDPDEVADVVLATATGPGGNLARRVALDAGLGPGVPGLTIDRQCGGGLDAVVLACRLVEAGAGDLYIAGGVESASTSPVRGEEGVDPRRGGRRFFPRRPFAAGGYDDPGMAESAETIANRHDISRERQDAFALESHRRAVDAGDAFAAEIVPTRLPDGGAITRDSCPRATLTPERMARFPPVVSAGGTVTAGNASQIADGAAAVVVASAETAARLGRRGLRHVDSAVAGVDPAHCGMGGVAAARALGDRLTDLRFDAVAHIAFTEAFASQVLATIDELGLDHERVNPRGGAIALGHPWGASGAMQVVRLLADLAPGTSGLALAAIAGGMGTAALFVAEPA